MATNLGTIIADFATTLATKLEVSGTSVSLQSATDDDGEALPSGRYFFTIDGDNAQKEHISCDLSGTSLTNIKSVSRQGVETTGAEREHRVGATVMITNFAHILEHNNLLDGTTDLDADTPLKYDGNPTISTDATIATKKYVDDVAIAGGADASTTTKGISKLSVAPASATEPIAVGANDPKVATVNLSSVTSDMITALAGTSGTPSSSNKYVTDDDVADDGTASKIVRATAGGKLVEDLLQMTDANATELTDGSETTLHSHASNLIFDTTEVHSGTKNTSFEDLDLSSVVGSNLAIVILRFTDTSGSGQGATFKQKGGTNTTTLNGANVTDVGGNESGYVVVVTNSSGLVEWKSDISTRASTVHMMAYLK